MVFLPDNYKIPQAPSNYLKFADGLNRFRILSDAIVGYEYFNTANKPVRLREVPDEQPVDIKLDINGRAKIKPFWAFVVWNYEAKRLQILELTQKSIMAAIQALVDNPKWGDPKMYDIAVTKTGELLDTEYMVQAEPPIEAPDDKILEASENTQVNLEALFDNGDPFTAKKK